MVKLTNNIVIEKANALGFDLVGFAKADILNDEITNLNKWLSSGYQAGMKYMERNIDKREDVKNILTDAKSVISLATNYYTKENYSNSNDNGKVSRYAWGKDYHLIIWEKLAKLENELKKIDPKFECKTYVDTGPVMDKVWAKRAGLGWLSKNSNIINKKLGSWIFLSSIITNYQFDYNELIKDLCGDCTACLDACPTNAIVEPYVVDSNKCVSYLTIENKGEIPEIFIGKFDNWLFGCDICQDVCPWNIKFSSETSENNFLPADGNKEIKIEKILKMEQPEFKKRFENSPINRSKLKGLKRNAVHLKKSLIESKVN
ncbi:MAG: tRNA epoxyqueuosine(34) reductase QueG [Ignavibacteriales bacterium CG_4_9_14_3_um_filter_30_11]|nr:MAG: tRNA epoxyqueuosine(34) reductase QueG [Ignavibacteriales bacterium CG_4_9_14_3_um_filter_30_11]